jgi:hypothetical protein
MMLKHPDACLKSTWLQEQRQHHHCCSDSADIALLLALAARCHQPPTYRAQKERSAFAFQTAVQQGDMTWHREPVAALSAQMKGNKHAQHRRCVASAALNKSPSSMRAPLMRTASSTKGLTTGLQGTCRALPGSQILVDSRQTTTRCLHDPVNAGGLD